MAEIIFAMTGLALLTILFFTSLWYGLRRLGIWRWKQGLDLNRHHQVYQTLFKQVDGFKLSLQSRENNDALEYVYGEIKFLPFIALLSLIKMDSETVFYDLGSGSGRAVLACAMVFNIKRSCGIEIFEALHQVASQQKERLKEVSGYQELAETVHFYHHNFLDSDLNEATVIFVNSTALFGESWQKLIDKLETLEHCQTIITTSKSLSSKAYSLIRTASVEMSWGVVTAYIHQRRS